MADAPPRARIVIPAYTNPGLRDCLDALRGLPDPVAFEVVVVLNGATLEVRRIAAGFAGWATILEVPVNLGVGGGFNHGFAGSGCDYLVELQDDAVVEAGWLDALVRCADREPDAGAVGSLSLDREGRVRDPGHIAWRDGTTSPALVGGSRDPDRYTEVRAVDYHGSSGLLIRRRAWESVSGIDPGYYPAYYGDVDLCFRLRERGWRVLVEPRSRLRHAGAQSSTSGFRRFVAARLRQRFVDRHGDALALHGAPSSHPRAVADEIGQKADVMLIGYAGGGTRNIFANRPAQNLAELKGLKVRVQGAPIWSRTFQAAGMAPTVIAYNEVYNAIQNGVIQAGENEAAGVEQMKFYEVGPNLVMTMHAITIRPLCFSAKTFKTLPGDLQAAILKAGKEAGAYGRQVESSEDSAKLDKMEKEGKLRRIAFADRAAMKKAVDPVIAAYAREIGADRILAQINAIK